MKDLKKVRIETKKFLIVVAAIGNSYYNDAMSSLKPNFIRQLSMFIDGPISIDGQIMGGNRTILTKTIQRNRIQNLSGKIRNCKEVGLLKEDREIFVLTDKAWDILGLKVQLMKLFPKEINSHSGNIERFDIKEYSKIKKEKRRLMAVQKKDNFIINYADGQGGIFKDINPKKQRLTAASDEAYAAFEDKIRILFELLTYNTTL